MNKWEWTPALDRALQEIVLRNYFNFDMVSVELNEESRRLGVKFGATHVFTNEKCRIRWSYLHLKVLIDFYDNFYRDKQENRSNTRIRMRAAPNRAHQCPLLGQVPSHHQLRNLCPPE